MLDDDASTGGAGDGVFSAVIPGVGPRTLVRYRVIANGVDVTVTSPAASDTIDYHGIITDDPEESTGRFAWFQNGESGGLSRHFCPDSVRRGGKLGAAWCRQPASDPSCSR